MGREVFRLRLPGMIVGDPAVSADGTIFVADDTGMVTAVSHRGFVRYRVELPSPATTGPSIGSNGIILVGGVDSNLYAIDINGMVRWNAVLAGVPTSIAIGDNGNAFVGTGYGTLVALNSQSGAILWDHIEASPLLPPVIFDESILIATKSGRVGRLEMNGEPIWMSDSGLTLVGTIIGDEFGVVIVRDTQNRLYRIGETGLIGRTITLNNGTTGLIADGSGILIGGSDDWSLYAYASSSLPAAGWSQAGQNGSHNSVKRTSRSIEIVGDNDADPWRTYLEALISTGNYESKRIALREIEEVVASGSFGADYQTIRASLEALVSDGLLKVVSNSGSRSDDHPEIRARAAELLPPVAGTQTNSLLANLVRYEYDYYAVTRYMRAIGKIGSDSSGAATRSVADFVLGDISKSGQPNPNVASAALEAMAGVIEYHGEPTDSVGLTMLFEVFRADYPPGVRETALDVIRSIRYY